MNWPWLKRIASLALLQLCALTAAMSQPSNGDVELLRQQVVSGGEIQRDAAFQQLVEFLPESRPALIAALDDHWTAYFARFSQLSVFKELDRLHGLRCELLRSRQVALSMLVVGGTSTEPGSLPSNEAAQIRAVERVLRLWESRERVSIENGVPQRSLLAVEVESSSPARGTTVRCRRLSKALFQLGCCSYVLRIGCSRCTTCPRTPRINCRWKPIARSSQRCVFRATETQVPTNPCRQRRML